MSAILSKHAVSHESAINAIRSRENNQTPEAQAAMEILHQTIAGELPAEQGAAKISVLYDSVLKLGRIDAVDAFFYMICSLAPQIGGDEQASKRIVDLLNSITELPDVINAKDASVTSTYASGGIYWTDLPGFSIMYRVNVMDSDRHRFLEGKASLLNSTTFAATFLGQGKKTVSTGMSTHAEVGLMLALEYQKDDAELYVAPAATWMLLAGKRIHELCVNDHRRDDTLPGLPEGYHGDWLWNKGRGFSVDRWNFWKERFAAVAENESLDSDSKVMAAKAHKAMEQIS